MATLNYSGVNGGGAGWTSVTTPDGRTLTAYGDRAMRNNNPGNIRSSGYARSAGAIGDDGGPTATNGRFAVFPDRVTGVRAQAGLIFGTARYANLTLREAIARYAPPNENNTARYAATVSAISGVPLDTKMKDVPADKRMSVVEAMHTVEGNTSVKVYDPETGQHLYTIDGVSPETPANAPTPFGPNTPTAMAQARPENFSFAGPKGKFSVAPANLAAAPVGKVGRASLAPAGMAQISPPGTMASPLSAAPSGKVTRASLAPPTNAPSIAAPGTRVSSLVAAPTSPVTRAALAPVSMPARPTTPTPATALAAINKPAFAPAVPTVAPQPTTLMPPSVVAPPAPPAPVARVSAPVSRPSVPAAPRATAMDVYSGAAMQAMDNTGKNMVSRDALGNMSVTNQYGVTTTTSPSGFSSVSFGPKAPSAPSSPSAISGPLSNPGISTPSKGFLGIQPAKTETGNIARGVVGSMVGSAIGGTLGPIGSMIGAALGNSIAKGKNPFDAFSGKTPEKSGMFTVNTYAGPMSFHTATPGLAFPDAPKAPAGFKSKSGVTDGMRGISPRAADAISKGGGGLY